MFRADQSCACRQGRAARTCDAASTDEARADIGLRARTHQATAIAVAQAQRRATIAGGGDPDAPASSPQAPPKRLAGNQRGPNQAAKAKRSRNPLELVDATVPNARVKTDDERRKGLADQFLAAPSMPANASVFIGNFSADSADELAIIEPGGQLSIYDHDTRLAHLELPGAPAPDAFDALGIKARASRPQSVRLVRDGTLQILMHWRETAADGSSVYKVGAFKVIGSFIGRIFEQTLASRSADGADLKRRGTIEVLRGDDHRFIRWIPANPDTGAIETDRAAVLKWNHWEGLFVVPKRPPTAPDRNSMTSHNAPADRYWPTTRKFGAECVTQLGG